MRKAEILPVVLLVLGLGVLVAGCQDQPAGLPPYGVKGNPRLSSQLNDLVLAEGRGEAALYARQSNIQLVDGSVRVIVEVTPGQLETVAAAARRLGTVETSYGDTLQVVLPVASVTALAAEAGVEFIQLPVEPMPAAPENTSG